MSFTNQNQIKYLENEISNLEDVLLTLKESIDKLLLLDMLPAAAYASLLSAQVDIIQTICKYKVLVFKMTQPYGLTSLN